MRAFRGADAEFHRLSRSAPEFLETCQNVRWRGRRWRVLSEERNGLIELVGLDPANRDQVVTPSPRPRAGGDRARRAPAGSLEVESTDRGQWRALHMAHLTTMAGGRASFAGSTGAADGRAISGRPADAGGKDGPDRLLIADDMGLGKTAEAGLILRWLAQRHQAGRVLVVTRATQVTEPGAPPQISLFSPREPFSSRKPFSPREPSPRPSNRPRPR